MRKKSIIVIAIVSVIVIVTLWVLTPFVTCCIADSPEQRGQFGDLFGSVNALFSGLAFAGMIITLWFQREELHLQRDELIQTREELRSQREEFEEQNKTLHRQRFENIFFNMLSLHEQITVNVDIGIRDDKGNKIIGRPLYKKVVSSITSDYAISAFMNGDKKGIKEFLKSKQEYKHFNQYFRHSYEILKLIDSSDLISDDERKGYVDIMRSQLADSDLALLAIYSVSEDGESFRQVAKRYSFFDSFPAGILPETLTQLL